MWDLGNRGVLVLISVSSGCVLLYNAWGPILAVTISFFLVVYACYSLIVNDSLLSPHAFLLLDYLREAAVELRVTLDRSLLYILGYTRRFLNTARRYWGERLSGRMERRRRSTYQLSNDSCVGTKGSPRFSLIERLSPIAGVNAYKATMNNVEMENKHYRTPEHQLYGTGHMMGKRSTSTPLFGHKRSDSRNGDIGSRSVQRSPQKKTSPLYNQNHTLSRGESPTYFSPDGSPWGTSISPKLRPKAGGVKTVQTVAGPLLASTRYNIDPKVYSDVTSPGLTTRLTKYATEANSKLTCQSQYGTGQFPKVNLHLGSVPVINAKSARMRLPVTVRIAPPEFARHFPPEKQKILSNVCQTENKTTQSVVQVLREISLKRHASREDVTSDLAKKQRTDGIFGDSNENLEEAKQKRGRDESSKSDEDTSPQSKTIRPTKRSKTPSCFDILNSLSSSIHVVSGVKRKAMDVSRSGTPDFEKHFKFLECAQNNTLIQSQNTMMNQSKPTINEKRSEPANVIGSFDRTQQSILKEVKIANKSIMPASDNEKSQRACAKEKDVKRQSEGTCTISPSVNVVDKLFMRAEPQRNEKLKSLIEEQKNIKVKFSTDDVEKIKKEDIVNMRQTSMRIRLQSMFDAISGKATSKINPDVVIQAEEVTAVTSSANCATLNSSTTTTNVNTTPISTSAITPYLLASVPNTRPTNDTVSNLHTIQPQITASSGTLSTNDDKAKKVIPTQLEEGANNAHSVSIVSTMSPIPVSTNVNFSSSSITLPILFNKSSTNLASVVSKVVLPSNTSNVTTSVVPTNVSTCVATSISSPNVFANSNLSGVAPILSNSSVLPTKNDANITSNVNTGQTMRNTQPGINNTFDNTTIATNTRSINTASSALLQNSCLGKQNLSNEARAPLSSNSNLLTTPVSTNVANNILNSNLSMNSTIASTASLFTFGANNVNPRTTKSEVFTFGIATSSNKNINNFETLTTTNVASPFNTTTIANSSFMLNKPISNSTGFGTGGSTASVTFGGSLTTSTFSFGTSTLSMADNKPMFSFGTNATNIANTATAGSSATPIFSTINTTSTFGPTVTTTTEQFTTIAAPLFGTVTSGLTFSPANSVPVFVSTTSKGTPTTFTNPKPATQVFGATANQASTGTTTAPTTTLFSSVNTNISANTATTTSSVFRGRPSVFGQAKLSTNFGGTNKSPPYSTPLFGSPTTAPSFCTTSTSTTTTTLPFGGTSTVSPTFGTQPSNAVPSTQNSTSTVFGVSTPRFGSENSSVPVFGTSNPPAVTGFGSAIENAFGGQNNNLTFNNTNNTTAFGENRTSPFGVETTTSSTFGTTNTSTALFGTSRPSDPTNMFSFGGNQKPVQENTFSFGSNNTVNNSAASTCAPFQFGASTSKPGTGFNFSAPSTTPTINFGTSGTPTFNAPSMFSIGSGSTAPRSKNNRSRKPR